MVNYSKPDIGVFRRDTKIHWDTANELRMIYLQNRSGQTVTTGEVVVWDTANPNSFKLTTTEGDVNVCGIIAQALDKDGNATTQTIANLEWGWVQTAQRCPKVKLSTAAAIGDFIQTSTTAGLGKPSADARPGSFAIALTSGIEVECFIGFISPSAIGLNIDAGLLYTDIVNRRVGILTTQPIVTLDVRGNVLLYGTDVSLEFNPLAGTAVIRSVNEPAIGGDSIKIQTRNAALVSTDRIVITGAQDTASIKLLNCQVGIGKTPETLIDVAGPGHANLGTLRISGGIRWIGLETRAGNYRYTFGDDSAERFEFSIYDMTAASWTWAVVEISPDTLSSTLVLTSTGVGFGTRDPRRKVHVVGDGIRLQRSSAEPIIDVYRSEAVTGYVGCLQFVALDSAEVWTEYAQVRCYVQDTTDGSEDSALVFITKTGGSKDTPLVLGSWGRVGILCWPDVSFEINGTTQLRRVADADATNTVRDSNFLQFQGAYWDGTSSIKQKFQLKLDQWGAQDIQNQLLFFDDDGEWRFSFRLERTDNFLRINSWTTGASGCSFFEAGAERYTMVYDGALDYLALYSQTAAADIIRVPDAQLTVDGNSTFDDNAFDFVCEECGWSSEKASETCPECGNEVKWFDDVALVAASTVANKVCELPKATLRKLERLGIINTYGTLDRPGRPEVFLRLTQSYWFALSAIKQLYEKVKGLEVEIEALKAGTIC